MCGITGLWQPDMPRAALGDQVERMADALRHRGPDDAGVWVDESAGMALGHRRLSIIDLSPEGHQPMHSVSGRYTIAFNGEIYNFNVLRRELETLRHSRWRGHSDTEVLLMAIEQWGVTDAIRRSVGMFAIALWDRHERVLYLARDRLGEKPLYYGFIHSGFAFGSELKALCANDHWHPQIDRNALSRFMRMAYVPAPDSIYAGVRKLPAGGLLALSTADMQRRSLPEPACYWEFSQVAETARAQRLFDDEDEAVGELDRTLRTVIASQMVADVPLGAFLSGGIDSSTVVALMQAQSARPVRTFTIGFAEAPFNEAGYARAVATHLGTAHTELYVSAEQARAVIPTLPDMYDEPFADSSQIPTYLVSALAREHVAVSLSGDGGDELFGGYNRYVWAEAILRRFGPLPVGVRRALTALLTAISPHAWDRVFTALGPVLPRRYRVGMPGDKVHKYAALIDAIDENSLYERLISQWHGPSIVIGADDAANADAQVTVKAQSHRVQAATMVERMMVRDTLGYLPDDILVKVDRAAMSVSLETRIPFLDKRVVELAWRMPLEMKIRGDRTKHVVRRVLERYVPTSLIDRPKMGFSVPLDSWLRGPLRAWVEARIDPVRIKAEGYLNPAPVQAIWQEHLSGTRNWQYRLWNVLMFQSWLERFGGALR